MQEMLLEQRQCYIASWAHDCGEPATLLAVLQAESVQPSIREKSNQSALLLNVGYLRRPGPAREFDITDHKTLKAMG